MRYAVIDESAGNTVENVIVLGDGQTKEDIRAMEALLGRRLVPAEDEPLQAGDTYDGKRFKRRATASPRKKPRKTAPLWADIAEEHPFSPGDVFSCADRQYRVLRPFEKCSELIPPTFTGVLYEEAT